MADYNILDYGAEGDGVFVCTGAIQRAIDLCEKGGTVYVPAGVFRTGALYLKSDMTLYLDEGAKLLGSDQAEDFPVMGYSFEGLDQICYASLLNTDGAPHRNITIDGKGGVIDANGAILFGIEMEEKKGKRGRAVCLRNTDGVTIRNVVIRQSPSWGLHLLYCRNVLIEKVAVHTKYDENGNRYRGIFNGDGIDIDSCQEVVIRNSLIASQDDCIAVKSGRNEEGRRAGIPSENITVEGCTFKSGFGVAVGSEMSGGVKNVFVRNCSFEDVFSIASIKTVRGRGGYIRNIHYENCSLVNRDTAIGASQWFRGAIYLDGFYGMKEFDADTPVKADEGTPVIEEIYLKDITVDTVAGYAVYLCGLPESHAGNIFLEKIKAHGPYGFYCKNVDGLHRINVDVTADRE